MKQILSLLLIFFIGFAYADIDIQISGNDIVSEKITMQVNSTYDYFEYTTSLKPVSVIYDGEYSIVTGEQGYVIQFKNSGEKHEFTLVYDNIVEKIGGNKIFRTVFYPSQATDITVRLPLYNVLFDSKPNVIPTPDRMSTDGRFITLEWDDIANETEMVVFYREKEDRNWIAVLIISAIAVFALFLYFKKKTHKHIKQILSSEEGKVIEMLRKGPLKQKDIASKLEFSKSKMSKVVLKLEKKRLIVKEPYFKTNILRLKKR